MIDEAAATELEGIRIKYKSVVEENNTLSVKVRFFKWAKLVLLLFIFVLFT